MTNPTDLTDADLDRMAAGVSSDPEWRYVPVRRTQSPMTGTSVGAFALPEVDDEVLIERPGDTG